MKKLFLALAVFTSVAANYEAKACDVCGKGDPAVALRGAMQKLWAEHMQWTYATVDAFFNNPKALDASLNRLLQNQKDIGAAIIPYYGKEAGDKLTALLTEHIQGAVPVLTAAQKNDQSGLKKALADWHANAQAIADFLSAANTNNWKQDDMRTMMKAHIDQTTAYAVDLLGKNYKNAVEKYDVANQHMKDMADELSMGIIKQFPREFKKKKNKKSKMKM